MTATFGGGGIQDEPRMTPTELEELLVISSGARRLFRSPPVHRDR